MRIHILSNLVSSARTLQHPALLQCLAQCSEVTPYLLVMEFCPLVGHTLMIKFCLFSASCIPHYSLSSCAVVRTIHRQSEQLTASCPSSSQGDLKSYLRSCRVADSETPDPLILQRMVCDIASGLLHLHKYNFIHRYSMSLSSAPVTSININTPERRNPAECSVRPLLASPCNNILVLPE